MQCWLNVAGMVRWSSEELASTVVSEDTMVPETIEW